MFSRLYCGIVLVALAVAGWNWPDREVFGFVLTNSQHEVFCILIVMIGALLIESWFHKRLPLPKK